ncbi:MAG: tail fiber domain-containing protein [Patescibacteria group bacterium]|jgi:hypothetical protein
MLLSNMAYLPVTTKVQAATARQIPLTLRVIQPSTRTPIDDGNYTVRYSIYATDRTTADPYPSNSDTALWTETKTIAAKNGILYTLLGSSTAFSSSLDFSSNNLFIGIRIGTDPELVPRRQLGTVASAINSDKLQNMEPGTGASSVIYSNTSGSVSISSAPVASNAASLLQLGSPITGGNASGTYLGVNSTAGYVGDMINLQVGGTSIFKVDSSGNLTISGTVMSGGSSSGEFTSPISVTSTTTPQLTVGYDASNYFTASVAANGATTFNGAGAGAAFTFAKPVTVGSLTSTGGISGASVTATGTVQGGTLTDGTATITGGAITATSLNLNQVSGNSMVVSTLPAASATSSVIQIGNALVGGNAAANGGTYISVNAPASGAGSAADFINLQGNGVSKFKVDKDGNVNIAGAFIGSSSGGDFSVPVTITSTTAPQLTVKYDNSNYYTTTVAANGLTTFTATGAGAGFAFGSPITSGSWQGSAIDVQHGGTGLTTITSKGVMYGNGTGNVSVTAAGVSGQCLVADGSGTPVFGSCAGVGSGATLQAAYENGNTITTSDARDLTVVLSNTATDANFSVNIATGSTGKFQVQGNGSNVATIDSAGNIVSLGSVTGATLSVGGSTALTLSGSNIATNSSIVPTGAGINLGSSSAHFDTGYFDNLNIGSTNVNGTSSLSFTIDTNQATDNVDSQQIQFYLGPVKSTYAALQWTGASDRFDLYSRLGASTYATLKVGSLITSDASATALIVAPSTTSTYYSLQVDSSAASAATGIKITAKAAGSGADISTISSAANENLTINAKGTGTITLGDVSTGNIILGTDGGNIGVGAAPGAYKFDVNGTSNFTGLLTVTSGGIGITAGGLAVTAGGVTVTAGGLNLNSTGIINTGSIAGGTTGSFSGAVSAASFSATGGVSGASVTATGTIQGGTLTDGTATITGGVLTASTGTFNQVSGTSLVVSTVPAASSTASVIQVGSAIVGGNAAANGGTYFGMNAPGSGAGSAADLANWQVGGVSIFKLDSAGNLTIAGTLVASSTGSVGYWSRSGTTISTATAGDVLSIGTIVTPAATNLALQPTTGIVAINTSGVQNYLRVYDSAGTKYAELTHDGTNAVISSSSGELQLTGSGTSQFILGSTGTAVNLLFQESSTLGGADGGGKTITVGNGADVFNLNVATVTYNVATLTAATGLVVNNSGNTSTALLVNAATGQSANLLDLQVNSVSKFSISAAGASTSTGSTIVGNQSITGNLAVASSNTTQTGTSAGMSVQGNSLTTGNLVDVSSSSLTSGNLANLAVTSTAGTASGSGKALNIAVSGANANTAFTAYGLYSSVTNTNATSGTNVAAYLTASGATTANYALQIAAGQLISQSNGAASTPAALLTGTWFSGGDATTTKPQLLVEPAGTTSTGWSTAGTGIGVNAATGFTGNLIDAQLNGVSKFAVSSAGVITAAGTINGATISGGTLSGGTYSGTASTGAAAYSLIAQGGDVNLQASTGIANINMASAQNYLRVYASDNTDYVQLTHDGTDGIISSSSGNLILQGTGTNQLLLGASGNASNLVFAENSSITSTGGKTITVGTGTDIVNLNTAGVTYNVTELTAAAGLTVTGNATITGTLDATLAAAGAGTALVLNGTSIIPQSSSLKYKTDITTKVIDSSAILSLRPVNFTWNQNSSTPGLQDFGLIAEETDQHVPDLVIRNAAGEITGVKYNQLAVLYLPILQSHDAFITDATPKINSLLTTTASLQSQINNMATVITTTTLNATTITAGTVNAGSVVIRSANAADTALAISAAQDQTGDLLSIKNSSSVSVFTVDVTGKIASGNSLPGVPIVGVDPNSGTVAGDLTSATSALKPSIDAGLNIKIAAGSVYTSDSISSPTKISRCVVNSDSSLALDASSIEYVYLTASGTASTTGQACEVHKSVDLPAYNANYPTVVIAKATTGINTVSNIVDTRFFIGGTFVYTNTAAATEPASAVINDTSADNQVKQTGVASMTGAAGVIVVGNSASGQAIMMTNGQAYVKAIFGAVRNTCAVTSTTAGAVDSTEIGAVNSCFGAVKTNASNILPSVLINISLN